jgi:steroid Delta-isomerase
VGNDDAIRETVERYLTTFTAGDRDGWLALFADDATLEDPVGSDPHRGREAIAGFWDASRQATGNITLRMVQGPNVTAAQCAFAMEAHAQIGDATMIVPTIDVMTFDADARITSQRAFWNPADVRPA